MKGTVLTYNQQLKEGIISGEDGNRYSFFNIEWKEEYTPMRGQYVDFNINDLNQAISIYILNIPQENDFNFKNIDQKTKKQLLAEESYGFFDWAMKCLRLENYANFSGRARRSEYWYFYLFQILISIAIGLIGLALGSKSVIFLNVVSTIINLALFIPALASGVRRLHDVNRSGWWWLLIFTLIGIISLFIWLVREIDPKPNQWGSPAK